MNRGLAAKQNPLALTVYKGERRDVSVSVKGAAQCRWTIIFAFNGSFRLRLRH